MAVARHHGSSLTPDCQVLVVAGQFLHLVLRRLQLLLSGIGFLLGRLLLRAQGLDLGLEVINFAGERMRNFQHLVDLQFVVDVHPVEAGEVLGQDAEHLRDRANRIAGANRVRDDIRWMRLDGRLGRFVSGLIGVLGVGRFAGRWPRRPRGGRRRRNRALVEVGLRERESASGNNKHHRECKPG